MKLLVILCVPFTAQHARPGASPGSSKQSNGWDCFKCTATTVKPGDISNTSVLPSHYSSELGPSALSPLLAHPDVPSCHSLYLGAVMQALGGEGFQHGPRAASTSRIRATHRDTPREEINTYTLHSPSQTSPGNHKNPRSTSTHCPHLLALDADRFIPPCKG